MRKKTAMLLAFLVGGTLLLGAADASERKRPPRNEPGGAEKGQNQPYSLAQAMSDQAQLHTIAFNGLAFVTGDFGAATFLPPGKVCDFFGFQYMRDIDAAHKGHNPIFLNRISANVLSVLNETQRGELRKLAESQTTGLDTLARRRLPLIMAFYRAAAENAPLSKAAVIREVGEIFRLDMELSIARAELFGRIAASLTPTQKAVLGKLKFGDFNSWPAIDVNAYKLPRGASHLVNVAYLTYASEFFSWYAGNAEADTYFCPERHGTYFGGFYMKDMPVMGKTDANISTAVTGDSGAAFLDALNPEQRQAITGTVDAQRKALAEVAELRRKIAFELRQYLDGKTPDREKLLAMGTRYGELDGEMSYNYATAFARVAKTLTPAQKEKLVALRNLKGYVAASYYIYSTPQQGSAPVGDARRFFEVKK